MTKVYLFAILEIEKARGGVYIEWKQKVKMVYADSTKQEILAKIHQTVQDGTLGSEYTIINREKNRRLRKDYIVNDEKIREILLDLKITDFDKQEMSKNEEHPEDVVYVFRKKHLLMPRYQDDAYYKSFSLYIKVTWTDDGALMLIISLHEIGV